MFTLNDKITLVTGAASGIGAAIAETFARAGAFVFVTDCDAARGKETVRRLGSAGGAAEFLLLDVTNVDQCVQVAREVDQRKGHDIT